MGFPTITNDGVSIAKDVEVDDPFENMGAALVKDVAKKTDDVAGDGTTTATVLAQALVHEGLRNVAAGADPVALRTGIEAAVAAVCEVLTHAARDVETREQIAATASISAADSTVGELVAEAMDKVGKEGVVAVEESNTFGLELEFTEGMRFDNGYISPYFVTDAERMEAVHEDAHVLIVESKISAVRDLLPLLEKVIGTGKPLLVLADDIDGEALSTLVVNTARGTLTSRGRQGPGLRRAAQGPLSDIAVLTGAEVISAALGSRSRRPVSNSWAWHGAWSYQRRDNHRRRRRRRRADRRQGGPDSRRDGERRVGLRPREATRSPGQLAGGVAVIKVGAATEVELKERKHRIEDAVRNAKAAIEEGLLPGGGVALANAASTAFDKLDLVGDEATGANIVRVALTAPLRQIAVNAGLEGGVVAPRSPNYRPGKGWTPRPASTSTCSRPASSNRPRSPAPRCRTPRPSPRCS